MKVEVYNLPISGETRVEVNLGGGIAHSLSPEQAITLSHLLNDAILERSQAETRRAERYKKHIRKLIDYFDYRDMPLVSTFLREEIKNDAAS